MARQCPNCGEEILIDKAQFCYNCGASLEVSVKNSGETMRMPLFEADDEETKNLPEQATVAGERSKRTSSDTINLRHDDDDEETKSLPRNEQMDNEAAISLDGPETADDDERTKLLPRNEQTDDGATINVHAESAEIDEATKSLSGREPIDKKEHSADLNVDRDLQDRYRLNQVLGKGGFGEVYLADDLRLNRPCVVKRMLTKGKSGRELRLNQANFEQEAKLLAALNDPGHPNIPEIYDYFSDESGNYLVIKYVEGRNLKEVMEQNEGALPWREAVRYALDVCSALNYMHTHEGEPVMHRDIKPANVLLGDDGRVWLVDFGLASADTDDEEAATHSSGSVGYTPLEQWLGEAVPASDMYALGATLHHMVTGVSPREAYGGEFNIVKIQEMHGLFPPIRKIDRKLPRDLETVIGQTVAIEPDERPSAQKLQQELEVMFSAAQKAALYTFRDGKSAKTVPEFVDLCEQNRREAEEHLYGGDFERWFLLIGRNDLAAAATEAVKEGKNQKDGLEKFLKLILPNIFFRRLRKATWEFTRVGLQFALIFIAVVLLVAIATSFVARLFIQQSLASLDWQFNTLDPQGPNHYTDEFFTNKFNEVAGVYFDNSIKAEAQSSNRLKVTANWLSIPLEVLVTVRLEDEKPHFYVSGVNGYSLFLIGDNISQGINSGVDEAFKNEGINVSELTVEDSEVVMRVEGMVLPTATPSPTPLPTPTATPTPSITTLIIVFNDLNEAITFKVEGKTPVEDNTWDIAANSSQVIEIPPGEYEYTVTYKGDGAIAATGVKEWTLDTAYRLRIGS